jgi:RIO kinase 1
MAFRARLWLATEFDAPCRLWSEGVPVPYPVQRLDDELMLELIGSAKQAAPRLVHAGLDRLSLERAWNQLVEAMHAMVRCGVVHGDLSAYNILWNQAESSSSTSRSRSTQSPIPKGSPCSTGTSPM